jgi:hypothetical protein
VERPLAELADCDDRRLLVVGSIVVAPLASSASGTLRAPEGCTFTLGIMRAAESAHERERLSYRELDSTLARGRQTRTELSRHTMNVGVLYDEIKSVIV